MTTARLWSTRTPLRALVRVVLLGVAALCADTVPAEASRECESPNYAPTVGRCARLKTSDLYYRDTGAPPNGNGQAVIFLHAGTGNADAFEYQLDVFYKAGYRAVSYDRKNFGRSNSGLRDVELKRGPVTHVQDLDDLATHLGIDRFHVVGVAQGGQVASQYSAWKSKRVLSLVLASTSGPFGLADAEPTFAQYNAAKAVPFEVFCPGPVPPDAPPLLNPDTKVIPTNRPEHRELGVSTRGGNPQAVAMFRRIEENAQHRTFDGCRHTLIAPPQPSLAPSDPLNPNTYAKIAQLITVRTLLITGGGDMLTPRGAMKLWGSHIKNAQWVMLDTGHAPQIEDPEGFNESVLRFLAGEPASAAGGGR